MNQIKSLGSAALNFGVATKNQVQEKGKKGLKVANFIVSNTDPLQKTCKVATAIFVLLATVFGSFVPGAEGFTQTITNISKVTKTTQTVIGATNVAGRLFEFTDEKARAGITRTWQKGVSRAALTVGQTLDTVSFVGKVASLNLGFLSLNVVGSLPVLNLVKGAFIVASSGFSIWDNAKTLANQANANANAKLERWKDISIEDVKEKFTSVDSKKTEKYQGLVAEFKNKDEFADALKNHKISKYKIKVENDSLVKKKSWFAIVADIAKIAIVTIGTVAMALVLTASSFMLFTAVLAVVVTSIGLAKTLYSEYSEKPAQLPKFEFV